MNKKKRLRLGTKDPTSYYFHTHSSYRNYTHTHECLYINFLPQTTVSYLCPCHAFILCVCLPKSITIMVRSSACSTVIWRIVGTHDSCICLWIFLWICAPWSKSLVISNALQLGMTLRPQREWWTAVIVNLQIIQQDRLYARLKGNLPSSSRKSSGKVLWRYAVVMQNDRNWMPTWNAVLLNSTNVRRLEVFWKRLYFRQLYVCCSRSTRCTVYLSCVTWPWKCLVIRTRLLWAQVCASWYNR